MATDVVLGQGAYREALDGNPQAPIWLQPWWLDATCGPKLWDALTVKEGPTARGALAWRMSKSRGIPVLAQAPLSLGGGPWVEPHEMMLVKWQAFETGVLQQIAGAIPDRAIYQQNWLPGRDNWLPFHWRGFTETTRYTYQIDLTRDEQELWEGMSKTGRRTVRKARDRFGIKVETTDDIGSFIRLNAQVFNRQAMPVPHPASLIRRIYDEARKRDAAELLQAADAEGTIQAMLFLVRDQNTTYSLMSGSDSELRESGALQETFWQAIVRARQRSNTFDFVGSMVEPIELFLRSFGPTRIPYLHVHGSKNRRIRQLERIGIL